MRPRHLLIPIFLLLASASGTAFADAGVFQFAAGDVRLADPAGVERPARKGEALKEGDTILTGRDGAAQIKMADGGFISVRANTRLKVDAYTYIGKKDGSEKSFFSLMAGGFRALTGMIGQLNKDNYKIATPSATIGIRGTDHEPMVILPGQQSLGEPGTYDKVNAGASFIATAKGVIDIKPNQVGFAPGANVAPVILPKIPAFYKESPPVPVGEKMRLEKEQGTAQSNEKNASRPGDKVNEGKEEGNKFSDGKKDVPVEKKDALSDKKDALGDKKEALGDKARPAQPGKAQAPGTNKPAAGMAQPPLTNAAPPATGTAPPAPTNTASPMLAPLPNISTTAKIVPLNTAPQPVVAPITTTKPLEPLAAPAPTGSSTMPTGTSTTQPTLTAPTGTLTTQPTLTAPTGTLTTQPTLTAPTGTLTTQPILTAPTGTLTTQPILTAPTGTLTTQPILTAPTTTTTTSPTLIAPLIKPLP